MNKLIISILAVLAIITVLVYGLSHAWMALGVLKFAFILLGIGIIGFIWGRLSS